MKKTAKILLFALLIYFIFGFCRIICDKHTLRNDVIRLHVVANSDSQEDQTVKLIVKDAIVSYLQPKMNELQTVQQAKNYITHSISKLTAIANDALLEHNFNHQAKVTLGIESFGRRDYDTFSLPAGVYESLRVEIGNADGKNWWCVVFPSLCVPTTGDEFRDAAVSSGFNENLTDTLSDNGTYKIRFLLLDWLGQIENFFLFR
ncbi:MAG: stage II sporulation protein R [Oscillospiraceae bacterium]|nr:stage II sporulation protein R [Oscillospiraceae bacterium]